MDWVFVCVWSDFGQHKIFDFLDVNISMIRTIQSMHSSRSFKRDECNTCGSNFQSKCKSSCVIMQMGQSIHSFNLTIKTAWRCKQMFYSSINIYTNQIGFLVALDHFCESELLGDDDKKGREALPIYFVTESTHTVRDMYDRSLCLGATNKNTRADRSIGQCL